MKRTTVFLLLILSATLLFSQSSSEQSRSSTTCFTDAELEAMEAEAARIMEDAVVEAVNTAVAPYRIQVDLLNGIVAKVERSERCWKTAAIATGSVSLVLLTIAIIRILTLP